MTTTLATLQPIVVRGESQTLEFKKSTNELHRVGLTLCGFLNTDGGQVIIGVTLKAAWSASSGRRHHAARDRADAREGAARSSSPTARERCPRGLRSSNAKQHPLVAVAVDASPLGPPRVAT